MTHRLETLIIRREMTRLEGLRSRRQAMAMEGDLDRLGMVMAAVRRGRMDGKGSVCIEMG